MQEKPLRSDQRLLDGQKVEGNLENDEKPSQHLELPLINQLCQMRQQGDDEELMDKEHCLTSVGIIPKSKCLNQDGGRKDGQNHLKNQRASQLEKPQKFELKTLKFQARMTQKLSWSYVSSQLLLENLTYKVTAKFKIQRLEQCNATAAAGPCQ